MSQFGFSFGPWNLHEGRDATGSGARLLISFIQEVTEFAIVNTLKLLVFTGLLIPVHIAQGQNITGMILGSITDTTGASVPGAEVKVINAETGLIFSVHTNETGYYQVPYLRPGTYQVKVAAVGFRTMVRNSVPVEVESQLRLDFRLEVGDIAHAIEVTGELPLIESETSSLGTVWGTKSIRDLPLLGRSVFDLVALSPGVQENPLMTQGAVGGYSNFWNSDISINGGRFRTNEYLVDGVSILLSENNNYAFSPTPDGTLEFKVQTNKFGAQFGRSGGGVINVITRGGTNDVHGAVSEYFRNDRLAANGFFPNLRAQRRPVYHFNMFSGAIGGPIIKNRTFFFGEYQGHRQDTAGTGSVTTLPTQLQRTGDFSQTFNSSGQLVVVYDAATTRTAPSGTGYVRDAFPGNLVPASRFDLVASRVVKYIPSPNRPGRTAAQLENYGFVSPAVNNSDYWATRVDHRFSDRYNMFMRFTRTVGLDRVKGPFGTLADNVFGPTHNRVINASLNNTITLSPRRVLNWRLGFTRRFEGRGDLHEGETKLVDLGFPAYIPAVIQEEIFPTFAIAGYASLGPPAGERIRRGNDIYTVVVDQTEQHGQHNVVYGVDLRLYNLTPFQGLSPSGSYTFSKGLTQGPDPLQATLTAGDGFASFLQGLGSGSITLVPALAMRNRYVSAFLNDDIRLGRLTVNIGVRYEYEQPFTERYNRLSNFDFSRPFPVAVSTLPNLRGVLTWAGRDSDRGQFEPVYTNFGPRFGLAYRVSGKMAVRAGFGMFYAPRMGSTAAANIGATGAQITTTWVGSQNGLTQSTPLSNPYPQGLLQVSSRLADRLFLGQSLLVVDRNNRNNNYTEQWNASVQREFPGRAAVEAAYTGSRGIHNSMATEFNQMNPSYQSLKSDLSKLVPNPFFGLPTTGILAAATVTQAQMLRPYPQYINIPTNWQNRAASTYHSLQLKAEKRFSGSMQLMVAYTTGKLIDDCSGRVVNFSLFVPAVQNFYDLRAERAVSEADVSQRLVISHTVDLPFGRGKTLLKGATRTVQAFVGGWSLSGVATFFTGFPLVLSSSGNSGMQGSNLYLRPNNTGKSAKLTGEVQSRLDKFFDTSVFTIPASYTFGNTGRTLPDVRGPGKRNYNLTLLKSTAVTERWKVVFRAEAYNLTNTPYFSLPARSLGAAGFGMISGSSGARVMQLGLRVQF